MKKFVAIFLSAVMCFAFFACSGRADETPSTENEEDLVPILGVEIRNEEASFYALTKSGTYTWSKNGEAVTYDGIFCLDDGSLISFTRNQTGDGINLKLTGNVESYKIYSAEKSSLNSENKAEILDEKYLVSENTSKITFPESGEYYYVIKVKYAQGEVTYGFLLSE